MKKWRSLNIRPEGKNMRRGLACKALVYFLCVSFLLLANGFHTMVAEAKEMGRPLGEMVSRGDVKFESKKAVWKPVELSQFPIFQGVRIKTEKGASLITLENNSQIDVKGNSLLSFDQNGQLRLTQGAIDFRIPPTAELSVKVGDFTVVRSTPLQASKTPSAVPQNSEATIGSVSVHSNGAITVKSLRGSLSVVNQERVVLAALSSKDTVTVPSVAAKSPSKVLMAQAGDTVAPGAEAEQWEFLGLTTWWWVGISVVVVAVVAGVAIAAGSGGGGGGGGGFVCVP
jgi:hypothetical protein